MAIPGGPAQIWFVWLEKVHGALNVVWIAPINDVDIVSRPRRSMRAGGDAANDNEAEPAPGQERQRILKLRAHGRAPIGCLYAIRRETQ